jgi:nucleoside-triphosphatase THEP1
MLSEEQQKILNVTQTGDNVIVDAVAGTGKTTLILEIAKVLSSQKILQITYNKSLKFEVRGKTKSMGIDNLTIHTYHSLAVCYYSCTAHVDNEIKKIVTNNKESNRKIPEFDMIVIDEAQDMTLLYYQLMVKFIKDIGSPIQLLILGDYMQGLYEFKGSDIRFLTLAEMIWKDHPSLRTQQFQKCTMKMSYRITRQMSHFVNNAMLGEQRMDACRDDVPVQYIRNSRFNIERIVCAEINKLFEQGVKPSDIFILGPSVKGERSNIRKLENMLVEKNIPCHVPMLENTDIDQRVIDGKIVFSTFHCVKGRQRKYVFVVGYDNSYFKYYARNLPRDICPNTLYVACTRASNGLYVLESDTRREDRPLEFLQMSHVDMKLVDYVNFKGQQQTLFLRIEETESNLPIKITPTELIKFIPEDTNQHICSILDRIFVKEQDIIENLEIPGIIQTKKGYYEEVSDLNGIAIPCMYYDHLLNAWTDDYSYKTKDSILYDIIDMNVENLNEKKQQFLLEIIGNLPETIESVNDYLYMANINTAIQESLYFKLNQIDRDDYNWLTDEIVTICKDRLRHVVSPDCQDSPPLIEEYIMNASMEEQHKHIDKFVDKIIPGKLFRFNARTDLITDTTVWEFKCTSELTHDHMLQLAIYAWLWNMKHMEDTTDDNEKTFRLFNIKTGELLRMEASMGDLNNIMSSLLLSRYTESVEQNNTQFINTCILSIFQLYDDV